MIDATWNGRSVQVAPGDVLRVALEEAPTSGHRWRVEEDGAPVCRLAGDEREGAGPGLGGAGLRRFAFEVVARGSARLSLAYGRSWAPAPSRRFTLLVEAR